MNQHHTSSYAEAGPRIYTKPELRAQLKQEILAGDQGGRPGEWSPRKAQLLAQEYKQAGGGYTFAKRSLTSYHSEDWHQLPQPSGDEQPRARVGGTSPRQAWIEFNGGPE